MAETLTPAGKLAVPDKSVAPQELSILLGNVGNDVAGAIVELAAVGLGSIPLLTVLGNELTELALVVEDVAVGGVRVDVALGGAGTKVLEAGGDGEVVELGGDAGSGEDDGENGGEMHVDCG